MAGISNADLLFCRKPRIFIISKLSIRKPSSSLCFDKEFLDLSILLIMQKLKDVYVFPCYKVIYICHLIFA